MNQSEKELLKLLVEVAFASVNHSLLSEAKQLNDVLPKLGLDDELSKICQSVLCFGMQKNTYALDLIKDSELIEAQALKVLCGEKSSLERDQFDEKEPAVQLIRLLSQQRGS